MKKRKKRDVLFKRVIRENIIEEVTGVETRFAIKMILEIPKSSSLMDVGRTDVMMRI
jgi:hypothetical protein